MRHRNMLLVCASAGAMLAGMGGLAHAQSADGGAQIEEVVVTARRVEENVQSIPMAITAVSGDAMRRQSVQTIADIQRLTPNLSFQVSASDPQALTVAMRGQKQADILTTQDPSVALYVDGVNLPRTLGMANAMVDLARVEVLRGPTGTLYGRNTTGGAVSIYSNDPTREFGASTEADFGNYDYRNFVGVLNLPVNDKLGLRLVAQRGLRDGYGHDAAGRELAKDDSQYYRIKVKAEPTEWLTAKLTGSYQRNDAGGSIIKLAGLTPTANVPRVCPNTPLPGCASTMEVIAEQYLAAGGAPAGLPAALGSPTNVANALAAYQSYAGGDAYTTGGTSPSASVFEGGQLSLQLEAEVNDYLKVRSITGYQQFHKLAAEDLDGTPFSILYPTLRTRDEFRSQELQLLGGDNHLNWVVGMFGSLEHAFEDSQTIATQVLNSHNPSQIQAAVRNQSVAVFGQTNWKFLPSWSLTLGARYSRDEREADLNNRAGGVCNVPAPGAATTADGTECPRPLKDTFEKPSWLASVSYDINADTMAYAKAARGYRTGGENLRGSGTAAALVPFAPETVTEYEVGVKADLFDRTVRLNLAAYHDDYNNIQRTIIVPSTNGQQATLVTNAAAGKINGVELEGQWRVTQDVTVYGSYGLTDGKYDKFVDATGDRSHETYGVPEHTATIGARYVHDVPHGQLAAQVDYAWQSEVDLAPDAPTLALTQQDAYGLLNARISYNIPSQNVELAVFGRNLADKTYAVAATQLERSLGFDNLIIGAPRTYGVQILKRFGGI